jgi:hypothetical protein
LNVLYSTTTFFSTDDYVDDLLNHAARQKANYPGKEANYPVKEANYPGKEANYPEAKDQLFR